METLRVLKRVNVFIEVREAAARCVAVSTGLPLFGGRHFANYDAARAFVLDATATSENVEYLIVTPPKVFAATDRRVRGGVRR